MGASFDNLSPEKKQSIIRVAMREFATYGYNDASTNRMVKEAQIGKGMLFYYFKNKQGLFNFLIDYGLQVMEDQLLPSINEKEPDFIERLYQIGKDKLVMFNQYPDLFAFMKTVFFHSAPPQEYIERHQSLVKLAYQRMYQDIDYSLFDHTLDAEKAMELIQWSIEGYQTKITQELKDMSFLDHDLTPYWDEYYQYLEVLKKAYYK